MQTEVGQGIKRGLLIVFEGLDRSGKSTQSKRLATYFQEELQRPFKSIAFPSKCIARTAIDAGLTFRSRECEREDAQRVPTEQRLQVFERGDPPALLGQPLGDARRNSARPQQRHHFDLRQVRLFWCRLLCSKGIILLILTYNRVLTSNGA